MCGIGWAASWGAGFDRLSSEVCAIIVLPEFALKQLMTQIVGATHGLTDTAGEPFIMSTIMERQLRMAALVAVEIATGQSVWPGDKTITIKRPRQQVGVFREE